LAVGSTAAYGLKKSGDVWSWGGSDHASRTVDFQGGLLPLGLAGDGTFPNRSSPVLAVAQPAFTQVAVGGRSGLAIKTDGNLVGWGANNTGQLGDYSVTDRSSPVAVFKPSPFYEAVGGSAHSMANREDGTAWGWGDNASGKIGNNATSDASTPTSAVGGHSFVQVASGIDFNLGLKADGSCWAWGDNGQGQLGDSSVSNRSSPISVIGGFSFVQVACGHQHALAIDGNGKAWSWGRNTNGPLGDNTEQDRSSPTSVVGGHTFIKAQGGTATGDAVIAGHSMWLKSEGSVWTAGRNNGGRLGDNAGNHRSSPTSVVGGHTFVDIAGAHVVGMGLKADGSLWMWGWGNNGVLGQGTAVADRSSPVSVVGGHSFVFICGGDEQSHALKADGSCWSWGVSTAGRLGQGTVLADRSSPVSVVGGHSFVKVHSGDAHTIAAKADGSLWAWGDSASGRLGDNAVVDRSSPVLVSGGPRPAFTAASCGTGAGDGDGMSAALAADGTIWTFGDNFTGQLGDGTTTSRSFPVSISDGRSFDEVITAGTHCLARRFDGSLWAWGGNGSGQLGDNSAITASKSVAVAVAGIGLPPFTSIAAGCDMSVGLRIDGSVWCWGANAVGGVGDNTIANRSSPASVVGNHSFASVASGGVNSQAATTWALKSDGSCWGWGDGSFGGLGDNTAIQRSSPVSAVGNHAFTSIAGHGQFAIALKADGSAWSFGINSASAAGALGDNTVSGRSSPVSVVGNHSFIELEGGISSSLALKSDGSTWAWGLNSNGAVGDNSTDNRSSPVSVVGGHSFVQAAAGNAVLLALKADGSAWAWGTGASGALGQGTTTTNRSSPVSVVGGHSFVAIAAGNSISLALKADGSCWSWGSNSLGRLGDNSTTDRSSPTSVVGGFSFTEIACGVQTSSFSMAIMEDGTIRSWGTGTFGRLGDNTITSRSSPVSVVGNSPPFLTIAVSDACSLGLRTDGYAWAWGNNSSGQVGDNSTANRSAPTSVVGNHKFASIYGGGFAGLSHALGLKSDGTAWAWGENGDAQLGDGTFSDRSSPVSVSGRHSFESLSAGSGLSMGLKADGSIWAWGSNTDGKLGIIDPRSPRLFAPGVLFSSGSVGADASTTPTAFSILLRSDGSAWGFGNNSNGKLGDNAGGDSRSSPVSVVGAHAFASIIAGGSHSIARKSDGTAWAWGFGTDGSLGQGTTTASRSSPVSVVGAHAFSTVEAGDRFSLALKSDGSAWGWGLNSSGQVGDNSTTSRSSPVSVVGAHSFTSASGGQAHVLALKSGDGSAWAWGRSANGALGQGTVTADRSSPVSVVGGHSFTQLSGGGINTAGLSLGLKADGSAWSWGQNSVGQLGDNSTTNRSSPVSIVGGHSFASLAAGGVHALGLKADGTIWSWGSNAIGQLGNGGYGNGSSSADRSSPVIVATVHSFALIFSTHSMSTTGRSMAIRGDGAVFVWGEMSELASAHATPTSVAQIFH
jgi:alpha-tubulin suppressor-like RCC1 family protein